MYNDFSYMEDVHQRRRSREEFGLVVYCCCVFLNKNIISLHKTIQMYVLKISKTIINYYMTLGTK